MKSITAALVSVVAFVVSPFNCGGGNGPSEACMQYVECQAHYDDVMGFAPTDTTPFDMNGDCWAERGQADACTVACADSLQLLADELATGGHAPGPCRSMTP